MKIGASHILVGSLSEAVNLETQIKNGTSFEELAAKHSKCPSGKQGGNLGMFGLGQMVKAFEEAAFNTPVGSVSGPVQTQFGYHLIKRTA
jgi:parvulin-like peptidyl-prolyl isomerase